MIALVRTPILSLFCLVLLTGCSPTIRYTPTCERDSDCAELELCIAEVCTAVECKAHAHCPAGEHCMDNECRSDAVCEDDGDCDPGWVCDKGTCIVDAECQSDADCAPDEQCLEGVCLESSACQADDDCRAVEKCLAGECVAEDYCRNGADCPPGQRCEENVCIPDQGCASDADCSDPTPICDLPSGLCVACVPDCTGICCGDDGCGGNCSDNCDATGQICDPNSCTCEGVCVPECAGRECGPDGCEGECDPGCSNGEICDGDGLCTCRADCDGKECGPDGCGGSCTPGCTAAETCDATGHCLACQADCTGRQCGSDPICGTSCGTCQAGESCNLSGTCGPWCQTGESRCSNDGFGFETCGPDPNDPDTNTYGPRIPCALGDDCIAAAGTCDRAACLETEVLLLLDRSSSMLSDSSWDWVTASLTTKLGEREARNYFGYREFPSGGGCSVGPVVSMSKNNLATITGSMTAPEMDSATPIAAALQGFNQLFGDPNDGQAVLLVSDGDETCDTQAEALTAAGLLYRAGIRVYVLAVTNVANKAFLDQLARTGGTGQSTLVTTGVELEVALEAIFQDLYACRCFDGDAYCLADDVFTCNAEQTDFSYSETCPLGCGNPAGSCELCALGETICQADERWTCRADRKDFEYELDCPQGCDLFGVDCELCLPGETRCVAGDLLRCRADGLDFEFSHVCPSGCENDRRCASQMILIPAGDFVRGSTDADGEADERPQRSLTLGAFLIDATEVTNDEYAACVAAGDCSPPTDVSSATRPSYYGNATYDDYPVIFVSWYQARDYCRYMGKRLPTEAEWERAARGPAPSTRVYPWGDSAATCSHANTLGCNGDTLPVGSLPLGATPNGILDMGGNVYEWTHDVYSETYYTDASSVNPLGPGVWIFDYYVNRSGSWLQEAIYARCANRAGDSPDLGDNEIGIRCARTAPGGDYDLDGVSPDDGDCDDLDPDLFPGNPETCGDGIDNNCNDQIDEGCPEAYFHDNSTDVSIPDADANGNPGAYATSSISVPESGNLASLAVHVEISHTYIGDLVVELQGPGGTIVTLHNRAGESADDINQTWFPTEFNGFDMNGTWTLWMQDFVAPDPGTLTYWSLELTPG